MADDKVTWAVQLTNDAQIHLIVDGNAVCLSLEEARRIAYVLKLASGGSDFDRL